jgi:SAM-dependent methyltransferase
MGTDDLDSDAREARPVTDSASSAGPTSRYPITEDAFDLVYPEAIRKRSPNFWTPVAVARRAAEFLAPNPDARVLDIGSGVGKFCIVGAATTGAMFSGIEHRPHLVAIAKRAAHQFRVSRVKFAVGMIDDIDWPCFDAFYLFNPFEENVFADRGALDRTVVLSEDRFWIDAAFVERKLARLPVGTRVATFHGFGGRIPPSYGLVAQLPMRGGVLRLWTKVSSKESTEGGTLEALMPGHDVETRY